MARFTAMIDIDNTVGNFSLRLAEVLNEKRPIYSPFNRQINVCPTFLKENSLSRWKSKSDEEFFDFLVKEQVLETIQPYEGAVEKINEMFCNNFDIVFCTARNFHPNAEKMTMDWLSEHGFAYDNLWVVNSAEDKQKFNREFNIVVDDNKNAFPPESVFEQDFMFIHRILVDPFDETFLEESIENAFTPTSREYENIDDVIKEIKHLEYKDCVT